MPLYRATVYAPYRDDPAETTVLVPRAGAAHAEPFQVTTERGPSAPWKPYLTAPTGRFGSLDPKTRHWTSGELRLRLLDERVATDNLVRWVTAFAGDAEGRVQFKGCKCVVEVNYEDGAGWKPYFAGRVASARAPDPGTEGPVFELVVQDVRMEEYRNAFTGAPHPSVTYARPAQLWPMGLPTMRADGTSWNGHPATAPAVALAVVSPVGEPRVANVHPAHQTEALRKSGKLRICEALAQSADARMTTADDFEVCRDVRARVEDTAGTLLGEFYVAPIQARSGASGYDGENRSPLLIQDGTLRFVGLRALDPAHPRYLAEASLPPEYRLTLFRQGEPTPDAPLLIDHVHPITLQRDLMRGYFGDLDEKTAAPKYPAIPHAVAADGTAAGRDDFEDFEADVSWPVGWWVVEGRATEMQRWWEAHLFQRFHFAARAGADGKVWPVDLRLPPHATLTGGGLVTLGAGQLRGGLEWEHGREIVSVVVVQGIVHAFPEEREAELRAFDAEDDSKAFVPLPATLLMRSEQTAPFPSQYADALPLEPLRVVAASLSPRHGVLNTDRSSGGKGWDFGLDLDLDFPHPLRTVAAPYLSLFGAGAAYLRARGFSSAAVRALEVGDWVKVDADAVPDPATNQRGGLRLMLIVRKQEEADRLELRLLDGGPDSVTVAPGLGTFALDGATGADLEVTSMPAESHLQVELAITDTATGTRPAEGSDRWRAWAWRSAQAMPAAPFTVDLDGLPQGQRVWARARAVREGRLPSDWVFPATASLDVAARPEVGAVRVTFDPAGAPTVAIEKNALTAGVRIAYEVHAIGTEPGTPLAGGTQDFDATPLSFALAGVVVRGGEALSVEVTGYTGWDGVGGTVTGTAGPVAAGFGFRDGQIPVVTWTPLTTPAPGQAAVRLAASDDGGTVALFHRVYDAGATPGAFTRTPAGTGFNANPVTVDVSEAIPPAAGPNRVLEAYAEDPGGQRSEVLFLLLDDQWMDATAFLPALQLEPTQSGATGTLTVRVGNHRRNVTAIEFQTKAGTGAWSGTWANGTVVSGVIGTDPVLVRSQAVALQPKHNSEIKVRVRYTGPAGTEEEPVGGSHTFDADTIAEVTGIEVSFDPDGSVIVSAVGDEDAVTLRATANIGSAPSDPTTGSTLIANARTGTVTMSVRANLGETVFVKVRSWNADGVAGPAMMVQVRRDGARVPRVKAEPTQANVGGVISGTLTLTIEDPLLAATGVFFQKRQDGAVAYGGTWLDTWDTSTGTAGSSATLTRAESEPLTAKHTTSIKWRVTYTDENGAAKELGGEHTFDVDTIPEVSSVNVSFDALGRPLVSVAGDEDCTGLYVKASTTSFAAITAPTPGSPLQVSTRVGVATLSTPSVAEGQEVYIKVWGYNSTTNEIGPAHEVKARRTAETNPSANAYVSVNDRHWYIANAATLESRLELDLTYVLAVSRLVFTFDDGAGSPQTFDYTVSGAGIEAVEMKKTDGVTTALWPFETPATVEIAIQAKDSGGADLGSQIVYNAGKPTDGRIGVQGHDGDTIQSPLLLMSKTSNAKRDDDDRPVLGPRGDLSLFDPSHLLDTPSADHTAIVAGAITYMNSIGGGEVVIPDQNVNVTQIRGKSRVALVAGGTNSRITQIANTTDGAGGPKHLVVLDSPNVQRFTTQGVKLLGNKANQTTANHAIFFDNTGGVGWDTNDQHHRVQDVMIDGFKGSGVVLGGSVREARIFNVHAVRCDENGFVTPPFGGTDNWLVNCTAEACGLWGFDCLGYGNRYVACKSFGCGVLGTGDNRGGFLVTGHKVALTACMAEENTGHGFKFLNCDEPSTSALQANANSGYGYFFDNCQRGIIQGTALSEAGLAHQQLAGMTFANGTVDPSADNIISIAGDPAEHSSGGLWDSTQDNFKNQITIGAGYTHSSRWGTLGGGGFRRHFQFGRSGSPAAGNPNFFLQTGPEATPMAYFSAFDGTTNRTFWVADFASDILQIGSGPTDIDQVNCNATGFWMNGASGQNPYILFVRSGVTADIIQSQATAFVLEAQGGRELRIGAGGLQQWYVETAGHFRPNGNALYDIGNLSNRARVIYAQAVNLSGSMSSANVQSSFWGTDGGGSDNEHFRFGKTGAPAAGNPYYVWKTDGSATAVAALGSWDGSTARTFIRADHGNNRLFLGDPGQAIGFYGVTPVGRQSLAPVASDLATVITLANDIRAELIEVGLFQ